MDDQAVKLRELVRDGERLRWEGNFADAEQRFLAAVAFAEANFGVDAPEVEPPLVWLSIVRQLHGATESALVLDPQLRANEIVSRVLGEAHARTAETHRNLGRTYSFLRDEENAVRHFRRSLQILEPLGLGATEDARGTRSELCCLLASRNEWSEALAEGLVLLEQVERLDNRRVSLLRPLLTVGESLVNLGRHAEARPHLTRLYGLTQEKDTSAMRRLGEEVRALLAAEPEPGSMDPE